MKTTNNTAELLNNGAKENKSLVKLLGLSNHKVYDFAPEFNTIIENKISGYDGNTKAKLKSFFEDLQRGGCISGLIGEFIYHADCKAFYVAHIDDLEEMKQEMTEQMGEEIKDRHNLPHYTFLCWLCFEEYCYDLYNTIFEG